MSDFWDVIVWMFWFAILVAWISLFIHILIDIFRDRELGGGAKALWCLLLIFLPFLGALIYLIARGDSMNQRSIAAARETESAYRTYIQDAAGSGSVADELTKLGALRDAGTISAADYEAAKAKVLA